MLKNQRGSAMVTVIALAVILNITLLVFFFTTRHTSKVSGERRENVTSLNIAEAGKERLFGQVRQRLLNPAANEHATPYADVTFEHGKYTVTYTSNAAIDTLRIRSIGSETTSRSTIDVVAAVAPDFPINFPPVRGAVTARSRITVKGNITIDGRDYDTNNVLVGNGTFGVSTCDSVFMDGSADIGGAGVAPVGQKNFDPVRTTITQEKAPVTAAFNSPESFLGIAAGALDEYKSSDGTLGEFRGLIYKTCDVGPVHFGNSYGVLIVHNTAKTAELMANNGTFRGLIITDRMGKITGNAVIIGAVVTICEGEVATFGTGSAVIHYSSQVLLNLNKYLTNIKRRVTQVSWKEVK
jgi:hypothetical protein